MCVISYLVGCVYVCVCWVFLAYRRWGDRTVFLAIPPHGRQAFAVMQQVMPMVKLLGCNSWLSTGFSSQRKACPISLGIGERVFLSKEFEKASSSERRAWAFFDCLMNHQKMILETILKTICVFVSIFCVGVHRDIDKGQTLCQWNVHFCSFFKNQISGRFSPPKKVTLCDVKNWCNC